jgi:hypothetical protein
LQDSRAGCDHSVASVWSLERAIAVLRRCSYLDRVCISVAGHRIQEYVRLGPQQWGWVVSVFAISYGTISGISKQLPPGIASDLSRPTGFGDPSGSSFHSHPSELWTWQPNSKALCNDFGCFQGLRDREPMFAPRLKSTFQHPYFVNAYAFQCHGDPRA